jgi:flagellar hook-associated protein 3 FlgL
MRISSAQIYQLAVQSMLNQQAGLAKTQSQIASGKRVQTPADDPVAAVQLHQLAVQQSQSDQYGKNSTIVTGRLQLEEQALNDANTVLQRARELVVQANTATLSDADRSSIATELQSRQDELLAIANRKDGNGEYLFAGLSGNTQPFVRGSSGNVQYQGDAGARAVQVDASLSVQDSDPGSRLFMDIMAGNGTFTTAAAATNTGSGVLDAGSVINAGAWVPGTYAVTFAANGAWQATDSGGNPVGNGTYTGASGSALSFNGIQVGLTGSPAAGDTFTVAQAGTQDAFSTFDSAIAALKAGATNDATRAQFNTKMNASLQQLDQMDARFTQVHAQVGSRLAMLGDTDATRATTSTDLQTASSQLSDIDYAATVSKMSQQLLGLQAAQQSYGSISKLSLFNYL